MMFKLLAGSLLYIGLLSLCQAAEQNDYTRTVSRFGSQLPATGYFYIEGTWTLPCANGVMYIDLSTAAGKAMWASILVTKKTGGTIYWINYSINSSNLCNANLIEVQ
ncbi:MAG TPA: hypothetical protein VLA61_21375 [Ideonella sp.]|uniref:hypothetical protein n=1 Tax=Ideonella sp. TaxID=1929293 RepID=UPI002CFC3B85|nr:hypothetical protein [Ideonella sp.]HSI50826.1 hypothetical protein [Ideonella sp.]